MTKKLFTPHEANKRLPLIQRIVEDILKKGTKFKALGILEQTPLVKEERQSLVNSIDTLIAELEALGCFFKDWNFEIGLVDFPATIDDQEVMLCWKSDEPKVEWYHGLEDGFQGRKRIPQELLVA